MGKSMLLLALTTLLRTLAAAAEEDPLPQVQTQGDVLPFVSRGAGLTARSHSCQNGTEFIVTFADDTPQDVAGIMNDRLGGGPANQCRTLRHDSDAGAGQLNAMSICIPPDQDVEAHLQVLLAMEGVEAIEENLPVNLLQSIPWHLDRIDQPYLPLNNRYIPDGTGRGVRVYITDTGSDAAHPEFGGRIQTGYSAVNGQRATRDMGNHGTHVAGIVGSRTYGVAKEVTIVPVKVFSDYGGGASNVDIIEGINWIIARERTSAASAVLSMSLGMASRGYFYAGEQVLARAVQAGVIPVVAAGNDHADACGYWPAQSKSVIAVGSTDRWDRRSSFSNYGSCVAVYAPGTDITSTLPNRRMGLMSGTSMACPVVSGTVALYLQHHPTASFQAIMQALVRNSMGQRNVPATQRMLLVQANERTAWGLLAGTQTAQPAPSARPESSFAGQWVLPLSVGCAATLIALLIVHEWKRDTIPSAPRSVYLQPEMEH